MMELRAKLVQSLFVLSILVAIEAKTFVPPAVERPVRVGAFNIQNIGQSKMANKTVMDIVKKIILRYDLLLIQEIVTTDETLMEKLVTDVNGLHKQNDSKYMMAISERLGRGNAKEQYAYLYRNDKFRFINGLSYPDTEDDFMRPPFIAHFATPTLRDMDSMIAIGIHTQPKNAGNETGSLAKVYDYAKKKYKVEDAIIMGDMNAGCANVRISEWDSMDLWQRKEFTWLIGHDVDTTLSTNCCPYDRIVIAGDGMLDSIIWNSIGPYKYREEYGLSQSLALAVSDHWPVEVKLIGSTSNAAKENLSTNLCLTVRDDRTAMLPAQLKNQKSTFGFNIEISETQTELYSENKDKDTLMKNFQKFQSKYQKLVSAEIIETIVYKVEHGALEDMTSNNEVQQPLYSILVYFNALDMTTTVHFCQATTIN